MQLVTSSSTPIADHVDEITACYDVDGLWMDIYYPVHSCFCEACLRGMAEGGVDAADDAAAGRTQEPATQ